MTAYFATGTGKAVQTQLDALKALFDGGTLVIYDGGGTWGGDPDVAPDGTALATFTFSGTAFGTDSVGGSAFPGKTVTATASFSSTTVTASATGTATYAVLKNSSGVVEAVCSVGTSGEDINFNSVAFSSGANITLSSFTLTLPE